MTIDTHLVKTIGGWAAADAQSLEAMKGFRRGDIVRVNLRKPRNPKHHRKAFSLLNLVYDNLDLYPSFDAFLDDVKLKCGHYAKHVNYKRGPDGEFVESVMFFPKSISFSSMSQGEFEVFYDRMFQVMLTEYLPGVSSAELEQQVLDYAGSWQ